jgi:hypothetical protein
MAPAYADCAASHVELLIGQTVDREEFGGTTAFADESSEDVPVTDSAGTGQHL